MARSFFQVGACPRCGASRHGERWLCARCQEELSPRCTAPHALAESEISVVYSPYRYRDELGELLREAKRARCFPPLKTMRALVGHYAESTLGDLSVDDVVPIPPRWRSVRERGFHIPLLFARTIAEAALRRRLSRSELGLLRWRSLRAARVQKFLSAEERAENMHGCFTSPHRALSGRAVLLVDDVVSSGATLRAAAKSLAERSPARIEAFALFHGSSSVGEKNQ
ncbi:hypothetical protein MRY87_08935 [bacterium]|nr:hypothetical protein [bacterium]